MVFEKKTKLYIETISDLEIKKLLNLCFLYLFIYLRTLPGSVLYFYVLMALFVVLWSIKNWKKLYVSLRRTAVKQVNRIIVNDKNT